MAKVNPSFPGEIWDGKSRTRDNLLKDAGPDFHDWDRAVAELVATQEMAAANDAGDFEMINASEINLLPGMAVRMNSTGDGLKRAQRNGSAPLYQPVGLVKIGADAAGEETPAGVAVVTRSGRLTLTTAQWDEVTGGTGGLSPNTEYYLDNNLGMITSSRPNGSGNRVIVVGFALSVTTMMVGVRHIGVVPA